MNEAMKIIQFTKKKSAEMMRKLLESAIANADHMKTIDLDSLYVKMITVNQGPQMKRFRPRAQGRAAPVRKRMSHINIILDER